ncbi:uncharacterized protein LOC141849019 [Brevipalpus obovatus]|uniref:uncharacterized protein LOC141849019 n=1 Tax=Brevipalpus obovatus TaxID=246614 RepID=UPI003D9E2DC2
MRTRQLVLLLIEQILLAGFPLLLPVGIASHSTSNQHHSPPASSSQIDFSHHDSSVVTSNDNSMDYEYDDDDESNDENDPVYSAETLRPSLANSNFFVPRPDDRAHHSPPHPPYEHPHHHHKPEHHEKDDFEKSLMHLIFPIIIVFGLGSLIVPMIAVFFAAFMYNNGSLGGGGGGGGCLRNNIANKVRTGREDLLGNIFKLLVTLERASSRVPNSFTPKIGKSQF